MAKMSELDLILKEIYTAAHSLIGTVDSLRKFFSQPDEPKVADVPPQDEDKTEANKYK